jgi:hypothetical protein
MPTSQARNEAKLLSFNWKTMATDLKVLRGAGKCMCEDANFCKAVSELKKNNNISDNPALEQSLENIVAQWPNVLYLTQDELSETIKCALDTVSATNFDDQTCAFMAEGILRTAHNAYVDKVSKIVKLSGLVIPEDSQDKYAEFKKVVDTYYPSLDEANAIERQVFIDLYENLRNIYEMANKENDEGVVEEVSYHLDELLAILRNEVEPSLEVAEAAAAWLTDFVETNLETIPWDSEGMAPDNRVYITTAGEHPQMEKNAKKGYTPAADFSGDWGSPAPVSDGKNVGAPGADKGAAGGHGLWGNIANNDTWPELNNPYVPAAQIPTLKGEKGADEDGLATDGSKDTWPTLQNPYVPQSADFTMKGEKGVDKLQTGETR